MQVQKPKATMSQTVAWAIAIVVAFVLLLIMLAALGQSRVEQCKATNPGHVEAGNIRYDNPSCHS